MTLSHSKEITCRYCYSCPACMGAGSGSDDDYLIHCGVGTSLPHKELVCRRCDGHGEVCAAPSYYLRQLNEEFAQA